MECSRASNARWIKIFSAKHQLALNLSDLPIFPIKPLVLSQILNGCLTLVPASVLDLHQRFVLANVAPPKEIAAINNKIRENGDLRDSKEGRHWLSLYGNGPTVHNYGGFSLVKTLHSEWNSTNVSDGIQIPQVQRLVLEQAEALLKVSDCYFAHWDKFIRNLQPRIGIHQPSRDKEGWLMKGGYLSASLSASTLSGQLHGSRTPTDNPPFFLRHLISDSGSSRILAVRQLLLAFLTNVKCLPKSCLLWLTKLSSVV